MRFLFLQTRKAFKNFQGLQGSKGFTLVELLVVIAIILILATAVLMIFNPAKLQKKSREAVLKANMSKLCSALFSCASVKSSASSCSGSFSAIGAATPNDPLGASYKGPVLSIESKGEVVYIIGNLGTCEYICGFNFTTGEIINLPSTPPSGCEQ